jgi:hypothetical protein
VHAWASEPLAEWPFPAGVCDGGGSGAASGRAFYPDVRALAFHSINCTLMFFALTLVGLDFVASLSFGLLCFWLGRIGSQPNNNIHAVLLLYRYRCPTHMHFGLP